ncbi:hypothetical protein B0I37DRAFT_404998 [Chaetomium sp. MPI-CAGE-AT-0009]|nr:hypothetical protein B0I37DRAFT_404998 [Chaetomium sp. MPI-CAGE-AT-0009]
MTAVYNHTAQQISTSAKKDSSDMKAIAVLTMAFLPATFVTTFFSMPFFDFMAPDDTRGLSSSFSLYWAVAGPLTISVLIIYGLYVLWGQAKYRAEERHYNASHQVQVGQARSPRPRVVP